jgi:serine/threonine-protein kinase
VNDYTLIKHLGTGGCGEVWHAEAPGGIEVAVKIIERELRNEEEAQRERQALEQVLKLRHPFLLLVVAFYQLPGQLWLVTDLAEGNLRAGVPGARPRQPDGIRATDMVGYFLDAAEALDYLHDRQVLHCAIKPENILILGKHAKVADFGLAGLLAIHRPASAAASAPAYIAPEVWRGKVSAHSDQYSLAVTYAELRLSRYPFAGRDVMELMYAHLEREPDLEPLPKAEQEVLRKALAKDPEGRYPSCWEFARNLPGAAAVVEDWRCQPPA